MNLLKKIASEQLRTLTPFRPGDLVRVHVRITEGDKERVQIFEGVVIRIRQGGPSASFTVRKISYGVGVERLFPTSSPAIDRVEVVARHKVRRARLFYLRERRGKAARLRERDVRGPRGAAARSGGAKGGAPRAAAPKAAGTPAGSAADAT